MASGAARWSLVLPKASPSALRLTLCASCKESEDVVRGVQPGAEANEAPLGAVLAEPSLATGDLVHPLPSRGKLAHPPDRAVERTPNTS
eukprot:5310965-Lingulodinium_polyedra.AAC.1